MTVAAKVMVYTVLAYFYYVGSYDVLLVALTTGIIYAFVFSTSKSM